MTAPHPHDRVDADAAAPAEQALHIATDLIAQAEAADPLGRPRPGAGWTPDRQRRFLELVADGATVEVAAGLVSLSPQSAYAFRRTARGAAFALGWRAASLVARDAIADRLMERALTGYEEVTALADGTQVRRHRYDHHLALRLLGRLDKQVASAPDQDTAAARLVAQEFEAYCDLVGADAGPARAGLFLAVRTSDGEAPGDAAHALAAADHYVHGAGQDAADLDPTQRASWSADQWARAEAAGLIALAPPATPFEPQPPQPAPSEFVPGMGHLTRQERRLVDEGILRPRVWFDDAADDWRTDLPGADGLPPPPPPPPAPRADDDWDDPDVDDDGDVCGARPLTNEERTAWEAPMYAEQARLDAGEVERRDRLFDAARAYVAALPPGPPPPDPHWPNGLRPAGHPAPD